MKKTPFLFCFLLLLFLFNGCNLSNLDFNKLSNDANLNPEIVAPVGKGTVSVWDMMHSTVKDDQDTIVNDPSTGLITIVYKKDNLYNYSVRGLFQSPSISVAPETITLTNLINTLGGGLKALTPLDGMTVPFPAFSFPSIVAEYNLVQISEFNSVTFKNGSMNITLDNKLKVPITIEGSLYDVINNRKIKDFSFKNIAPNGTSTDLTNLAGVQISNKIEFRMSTFNSPGSGSSAVKIDLNDFFKLSFSLSNYDFQSLTGDFGKKYINIDPAQFDMNVNLLNKLNGSLKLTDPKLKLVFNNPVGMPGLLNVGFRASNKSGTTVTLIKNSGYFEIPVPTSIDKPATGSIVFDKNNSNIIDFIALPPSGKIWYQGQVSFNQLQPVTMDNPNFIDLDKTFSVGLEMELPLQLQTSNLAFTDTSAITGSNFDKIETADLVLNATNGIPLDIDMQLLFVDTLSKNQYGTSKKSKVLSAAQVSATGVITTTQSMQTFSLDKTEMENLRKANGIVFLGTISSPAAGTALAPIKSDSKIELTVVIKSKVNL